MNAVRTYCSLRLGDNLAAMHFVRKLAMMHPRRKFVHYALAAYVPQLVEVTADLDNARVLPLEEVSNPTPIQWLRVPKFPAVNLWKNAGGFWENHPQKLDYADSMIAFFEHAAKEIGLFNPIQSARDLLFDYPALVPHEKPCEPFDFLIINSPPQSGQFPHFSADEFDKLISGLARKFRVVITHRSYLRVVCTQAAGLNVTQIGQISQYCRAIVMVSTGPSWPTFNIWNQESVKCRVIVHGDERVNLSPNTIHTDRISKVEDILAEAGMT